MLGFECLEIVAGLVIFLTFWGWLPSDAWWVRGTDFPRIQIIIVGALVWLGLWFYVDHWHSLQIILFALLSLALLYQLKMILPYTLIWKKQVKTAVAREDAEQVSIIVSNVLTPNNNTAALLKLVEDKKPDILLTLESDHKWEMALSAIESDYPHTVKVPLDNLYGMHLYSKFPLHNPEVRYLVIDDIPSITTQIELKSGQKIWLYCLHPMPPSPTEADKSTTRDAELLLVGAEIKQRGESAILAGDLNDVAWSKTTRLFQQISGLLDPRIGRHFMNTFHAKLPFLRWALDHLFHSPCFTLVHLERLPSIDSDHFPVLTVLQYEPDSNASQAQAENAPTACAEDHEEMEEKIEEGKEEGAKMSAERAEEEKMEKILKNAAPSSGA